ncbi:MAG: YdcF family protein [Rhodospirillaceae bacterium]|nr:YdcF family protein [Rhodospirillaceae bacterium]
MIRFFKYVTIAGMVLSALWAIGWVWFASALPTAVADDDAKTDAIVVLTGGSGRVEEGLKLLREGQAAKLFISGAGARVSISELVPDDVEHTSDIESAITLGRQATDTPGNAAETAAWAKRENVGSIRLVTAGFHMPRSLLEFSAAMPDIKIVPHPVFSDRIKADWWRWPGTANLIAREYTKYLLTWFRIRMDALFGPGAA